MKKHIFSNNKKNNNNHVLQLNNIILTNTLLRIPFINSRQFWLFCCCITLTFLELACSDIHFYVSNSNKDVSFQRGIYNFELDNTSQFSFNIVVMQVQNEELITTNRVIVKPEESIRAIIDATKPVYIIATRFLEPLIGQVPGKREFSSLVKNLFERPTVIPTTKREEGPPVSWTIRTSKKEKTVFLQLRDSGTAYNYKGSDVLLEPAVDSRYFQVIRGGAGYTKSNLSLDNNISNDDISRGLPDNILKLKVKSNEKQKTNQEDQPIVREAISKEMPTQKIKEQKPKQVFSTLPASNVNVKEVSREPQTIQEQTKDKKSNYNTMEEQPLKSEIGQRATLSTKWRFELSNKSGEPLIVKILDQEKSLIFQTKEALKPAEKLRIATIDSSGIYLLLRQPGKLGKHEVVKYIQVDLKKHIYVTVEKKNNIWIVRPQKGGGFLGTEGKTESGLDIGYNVMPNDISNYDESKL